MTHHGIVKKIWAKPVLLVLNNDAIKSGLSAGGNEAYKFGGIGCGMSGTLDPGSTVMYNQSVCVGTPGGCFGLDLSFKATGMTTVFPADLCS